mgnify:CR=1 FL=1
MRQGANKRSRGRNGRNKPHIPLRMQTFDSSGPDVRIRGNAWQVHERYMNMARDAFQAGLYGVTRNGPAYVAGALAFAEHWMTTDRFAFAGDHLTASFNAQNYGGRIEGGWRFATVLGGVAPYAAVQAQAFHTPAYNEADNIG